MKKFAPILIILFGFCIWIGGWIYNILFAGIPYQDPTPEMTARYDLNASIASGIRWAGFAILIFGIVFAIVRRKTARSVSGN